MKVDFLRDSLNKIPPEAEILQNIDLILKTLERRILRRLAKELQRRGIIILSLFRRQKLM